MDRLIEAIRAKKNPTVAGLDPKLSYIPQSMLNAAYSQYGKTLEGAAAAVLQFNKGIIDALASIVPAVKPQCAYYEQFGWQGMRTLEATIRYAQEKGLYVILDGKRNDIGTTMQAYAQAHLGTTEVAGQALPAFAGDALTVNPYLGADGIEPLLPVCKRYDRSAFVLVKTSNPSSGELQDRTFADGKTLYATVGGLCEQWGADTRGEYGYSRVGAVVGATYPAQLAELRRALPHTFFLVPGYGAQGGGAKDVAPAFDERGLGAVVNASRSILTAWQKTGADERDYAAAAAKEAVRMRDDIVSEIGGIR
ncbi:MULTISPECIES: orotidine-5'-phosphate decarboxylase [Caproicibacterium]|jgi:orotidine-5'-phosphate decarboxylase|uniref:Orotidine 5'-phosphate decarboxylase n=1 Tax=Caproicibacterium lactatifermentans TaxID=2666138 RepID=A0A859DRD8_9FIRM|nr:orotidine-5'-phosphate decarboxylase [Caproicibacterium lactatifermentans]ARP49804.1 orotidine-5'-phosphate decarboxylase [Ruminococcaceae bacterium CPB6]MDD4807077.1 orotidine-5'-phosphate decarboxylase [Oscillospiraceae bacterium]QKN24468.1 orotidine-5'-phosphate decarboxylase [Caproicibacterium lactatifermentans]QKO30519.1 orotidine-5'-phosphate decarboxylase [Caproicibacterium lactatifermentans]